MDDPIPTYNPIAGVVTLTGLDDVSARVWTDGFYVVVWVRSVVWAEGAISESGRWTRFEWRGPTWYDRKRMMAEIKNAVRALACAVYGR